MTILNYADLPDIEVSYILRDSDITATSVNVTNQEKRTTASYTTELTVGDTFFSIDVTDILTEINENTTFLVELVGEDGNPLYRDIVVFSGRLDIESDYEEDNDTEEYVYG